jgi:hypothetical protein
VEPTQPDPLASELSDAERALEAALEEACATPAASEVDTGELIRVEEMIDVASEAAKRAVSLRRRRRAQRAGGTAPTRRGALADAEAAASAGATHRGFTDRRGVTWDVFAVYPEARLSPHSQLRGTFQQGWLCFDAGTEKRRLSPIPENWQALSEEMLETLAERAEVAGRRRRRSGDEPGPTETRPPAD